MTEIRMPSAGQTTDEATIVSVNVKPGDTVKRGDVLVEAETDKAVLPVESFAAGKVLAVLVEEGSPVTAGTPIVVIGKDGEEYAPAASADAPAAAKEEPAPAAAPAPVAAAPQDEYLPIIKGEAPVSKAAPAPASHPVYPAMPGAKALARELGVDIKAVNASNGQFVKRSDVTAYTPGAATDDDGYEVLPMSNMRRIIARRMLESANTIPSWQGTVSIRMDQCIALRDYFKKKKNIKLSYNDILAKAVAVAAKRFPLINARFENDEVRIYRHTNIGLAVGLESALVVPVARSIDTKSLEQISGEYAALVKKAREGRLLPDEMGCGSVTISNLGMYDIEQFNAIVNPPESCILAAGSIKKVPEWDGSAFVPVSEMKLTGAFDHRIIDGAYGAQFLQALKELLENPVLIFA